MSEKEKTKNKFDCLIDCWLLIDDKTLNNEEKNNKIKKRLKELNEIDKKEPKIIDLKKKIN